jgi:hypothetical protein
MASRRVGKHSSKASRARPSAELGLGADGKDNFSGQRMLAQSDCLGALRRTIPLQISPRRAQRSL